MQISLKVSKLKTKEEPVLVKADYCTVFLNFQNLIIQIQAYTGAYVNSLIPIFNEHTLEYMDNQVVKEFLNNIIYLWSSSLIDASLFSNLIGATYAASFPEVTKAYACTVIAPYYDTGAQQTILYDTLTDSISVPNSVDTLQFSHSGGTVYDSIDYSDYINSVSDTVYRIYLNKDLEVNWKNVDADWYVVQVQKVLHYGYLYKIGTDLDTFVTDTSISIPQEYLYQPDSDSIIDDVSYTFLSVRVFPVNGAPPSEWDSLPDFNNNGYLFGITYDVIGSWVTTVPFYEIKAAKTLKKMPGKELFTNPDPREILGNLAKRYIKK